MNLDDECHCVICESRRNFKPKEFMEAFLKSKPYGFITAEYVRSGKMSMTDLTDGSFIETLTSMDTLLTMTAISHVKQDEQDPESSKKLMVGLDIEQLELIVFSVIQLLALLADTGKVDLDNGVANLEKMRGSFQNHSIN